MITCLPPELIDGIVSHLSDTQTLQSCCLAAWLFRDPCQRRLFHAMTLSRDGWDGQTFAQAQRLFDGRREIAKYVSVLRLLLPTANVNYLGYGQWQSPPESQSSDGATAFVPAALAVLAALSNVRYLEISTGTLPVSWRELPAEFASATVDLVRQCRGTLQKLVLRNIYELPRGVMHVFLTACPRIQVAEVRLLGVDDSEDRDWEGMPVSGTLERLAWRIRELRDLEAHAKYFLGPYTRTLRALVLDAEVVSERIGGPFFIPRLCAAAAPTLEYLRLDFGRGTLRNVIGIGHSENVVLPPMPHLRQLAFGFVFDHGYERQTFPAPLPALLANTLVSAATALPALTELVFKVVVRPSRDRKWDSPSTGSIIHSPQDYFPRLDDVLAQYLQPVASSANGQVGIRVRWVLATRRLPYKSRAEERKLGQFFRTLRGLFPRAVDAGMEIVEEEEAWEAGRAHWPGHWRELMFGAYDCCDCGAY